MNKKRNSLQKFAISALALSAGMAMASPEKTTQFNIPAQSLDAALAELSTQSNILIVAPQELMSGKKAPALSGIMSTARALETLLKDSGLKYAERKNGQVVILLESGAGVESGASERKSEDLVKQIEIEEMIVTAQKRAQSLEDVPMSIVALGKEDMERRNLAGMSDYLNTIPGVTQFEGSVQRSRIAMRGIGGLDGDPAVGVYFGEVPLTGIASTTSVDMKLVDMERIEVLRGPQGTLYGSGSMSGTVRNIPVTPDLETLGGELTANYSNTAGAGGANNKVVGVVNVPVIDGKLALRVAAYRYNNSGYINNIAASYPGTSAQAEQFGATVRDKGDVGNSEYTGVRATLKWQPIDELNITFMHARQDLEQDGSIAVNPQLGGYQANHFELGNNGDVSEYWENNINLSNLVIDYDMQWASVLSSSTWFKGDQDWARDASHFIGLPIYENAKVDTDGFTQEIRLVSQLDGPFQFVLGAYYENLQRAQADDVPWGGDPALMPAWPGADPNNLFDADWSWHVQQTAFFGEVTYNLTEQFAVTLGGRVFDYDRRDIIGTVGFFAGGAVFDDNETTEDGVSGKFNITYTPTDDALLYAQWSEGFRLGKPVKPAPANVCDKNNDGLLDGTLAPINPGGTDSDTLENYELGGKFSLLENRLTINTALYHIKWDGIPVLVSAIPSCGSGVLINAGEAVSQGVEFESSYQISDALYAELGLSYVDAELSKDDPILGVKGSRLPGAARANYHIGLQYEFQMVGYESFIRADYAWLGGFHADLAEMSEQGGDYGMLNMRAGVYFDDFSVQVFGNNLINADEFIDAYNLGSREAFRLRPRTIGMEVNYQF